MEAPLPKLPSPTGEAKYNALCATDVVVVGAGPTGLAAAIEAVRHGLSVKIVDAKTNRSVQSKALVTHARTLEVFEHMGLIQPILGAGQHFAALNAKPGSKVVRIDLKALDWGDTRYPFWLSIPQDQVERCMEEHLAEQGVAVEWGTIFESFVQGVDFVNVSVRNSKCGSQKTVRANWLVACDGGRSTIREQANISFERENSDQTFIVADASGETSVPENEGFAFLSRDGAVFLVPMPKAKSWRIIAHMPNDEKHEVDSEFINKLIADRLGFSFESKCVSWSSRFVVQHAMAEKYRAGRVFLAGDAAHLSSPVGGQGMNTGIQDAYSLMWRLALTKQGSPTRENLLQSYEIERKAAAADMVKHTSRATKVITIRAWLPRFIRGSVATRALHTSALQSRFGRTMGMLNIKYISSPILIGRQRRKFDCQQGMRLPNLISGKSLHDKLHSHRHTVLVLEDHVDDKEAQETAQALHGSGVACVYVVAAAADTANVGAIFVDTKGVTRKKLGGARVAVVRPDRVIALLSSHCAMEPIRHYANDILGVLLGVL